MKLIQFGTRQDYGTEYYMTVLTTKRYSLLQVALTSVSMVIGLSFLISKSLWGMVNCSHFYSLLVSWDLLLIFLVVTGVMNYSIYNQNNYDKLYKES